MQEYKFTIKFGGSGSGNFGHEGRQGQVGGSGEGNNMSIEDKETKTTIQDFITASPKIKQSNTPENMKKLRLIENYIEKAPKYNGRLYRGLGGAYRDNKVLNKTFSNVQKGDIIDMNGISSWSSNKRVATDFAMPINLPGKVGVLLSINNSRISNKFNEEEVLHSSKTRFQVINKKLVPIPLSKSKRWEVKS